LLLSPPLFPYTTLFRSGRDRRPPRCFPGGIRYRRRDEAGAGSRERRRRRMGADGRRARGTPAALALENTDARERARAEAGVVVADRKSTRLNSSHSQIS